MVLIDGFRRGVVDDLVTGLDFDLAGDPLEFFVTADLVGELRQDRALGCGALLQRGRLDVLRLNLEDPGPAVRSRG